MSTMRKVMFTILGIDYIIGCGIFPQLMNIWNREGYIGPFPTFIAGLWIIAAILVLGSWFMYWYERNDKTFED